MLDGNLKLAVLGAGTMGSAIVRGAVAARALVPGQVIAVDVRLEAAKALADAIGGGRSSGDALEACRAAGAVLIAVKPQQVGPMLDRDEMRAALKGKLVMSIAAGVRLEQLSAWLPDSAVCRVMPNTPAQVGAGMSIVARGAGVSDAQVDVAKDLFRSVGRCIELEDKLMDVVTALSGSGPAFVFVLLDALADGGVRMGLRRDVAVEIAAQVMQGSARMVLETGQHPAALKDQVTTPGGCTIAGLLRMEDGGIRGILARAVEEATRTAGGLGQKK